MKQSQKQNIPLHLRDPSRDKDSFGDGAGYHYPHKSSTNWVPQQYLPDGLQNEIFWEPSKHGWEGERKSLVNERRSEQLASFIEVKQQNPLTITSVRINSNFDKWFFRQIAQEGARLKNLMVKEKES